VHRVDGDVVVVAQRLGHRLGHVGHRSKVDDQVYGVERPAGGPGRGGGVLASGCHCTFARCVRRRLHGVGRAASWAQAGHGGGAACVGRGSIHASSRREGATPLLLGLAAAVGLAPSWPPVPPRASGKSKRH
jgi:hypothetical protein